MAIALKLNRFRMKSINHFWHADTPITRPTGFDPKRSAVNVSFAAGNFLQSSFVNARSARDDARALLYGRRPLPPIKDSQSRQQGKRAAQAH
jgi:hypothetical protein